MNITSITLVLRKDGADELILSTDSPSPMPELTGSPATMSLNVTRGNGAHYASTYFAGVPMNVLDCRRINPSTDVSIEAQQ